MQAQSQHVALGAFSPILGGGGVPPSPAGLEGTLCPLVHLSPPWFSVLWMPAALTCSDIPPLGGGAEGRWTRLCWALGPQGLRGEVLVTSLMPIFLYST